MRNFLIIFKVPKFGMPGTTQTQVDAYDRSRRRSRTKFAVTRPLRLKLGECTQDVI